MKTKKIVITSVVVFLTIVAIFVISSLVFQNVSFQLVNSPTLDEKAANNNGVSYGYTVSSGYPEWGHIIIIPKTHDGKPVDRIDGFAGKHSTRATKIVIPDSIKVIGAECFRENPYVKEIIIGENVTTIYHRSFATLESIEKIDMRSKNLSFIDVCAFWYGCPENIVLPSTVETIVECAFYAPKLQTITYEGTMEQWTNINFKETQNLNYKSPFFDLPKSEIQGKCIIFEHPITLICTDGTVTVDIYGSIITE